MFVQRPFIVESLLLKWKRAQHSLRYQFEKANADSMGFFPLYKASDGTLIGGQALVNHLIIACVHPPARAQAI